ncbi:unnamed protein product [Polarella glacialis]|uniref:Selenoprotein F/M domain-containing protein n=1 Tax=Polarella glacialis TaxID=89957 RepID=A0A813JDY4_POLGL|nr:unnamed protein product [Polarella glacialis]
MKSRGCWLPFAAALLLTALPSSFIGLPGPSTRSLQRPRPATRRASPEPMPEAPEGGAVIHVEYCEFCKYLPNYVKLRKAVTERFGEKVTVVANHEETLQELIGQPNYRHGSFEITEMKSRKVLHTKIGSGLHVTEKQTWMDKLFKDLCDLSGVE